jgi:two-component system chemotaxis sensor kinase CheA
VQPGFSTASHLTEISGRGMGLSIVDKAVRRLRGTFDIASGGDGGTIATIAVPLAIVAERVLSVRCGEQVYCLPVHAIDGVRSIIADDISTIGGEPFITAADGRASLPLAALARILGVGEATPAPDGKPIPVVVLTVDDTSSALAVDAFDAVQDAVVHDLEATVPGLAFADGAIVRADGRTAILLDPQELIGASRALAHDGALEPQSLAQHGEAPEILIVDDSITTRTLEKSILEATGYRVRLSTDGVDALEQLHRKPVDLIIADVEMPRMDGFDLLHTVRGDARLKDIPLILVTSRDAPEDRHKGLALGAQAYIVKQRFDQRDLLAAIEQIL